MGLNTWKTKDVRIFLKMFGFVLIRKTKHETYSATIDGVVRNVQVSLGNKNVNAYIMNSIVSQSGIPGSEWKKYRK